MKVVRWWATSPARSAFGVAPRASRRRKVVGSIPAMAATGHCTAVLVRPTAGCPVLDRVIEIRALDEQREALWRNRRARRPVEADGAGSSPVGSRSAGPGTPGSGPASYRCAPVRRQETAVRGDRAADERRWQHRRDRHSAESSRHRPTAGCRGFDSATRVRPRWRHAPVAKQVDAPDSKSGDREVMPVRLRPGARPSACRATSRTWAVDMLACFTQPCGRTATGRCPHVRRQQT